MSRGKQHTNSREVGLDRFYAVKQRITHLLFESRRASEMHDHETAHLKEDEALWLFVELAADGYTTEADAQELLDHREAAEG